VSDFQPPGGPPPPPPPPPPEQPPGPGWWKASDGNWYPPEQAPQQANVAPPPAGQPYGHHYPQSYAQYGAQQTNGVATWALALGIASVVLFWTFGFGILLGIIAVILGVMGRNRANDLPGRLHEGRANAGLITGVLGIIGGVLFFGFLLTLVDDVREEIERQQDDGICDPDTIWDPDC
jgi:hypothetical protein